MCVLDFFLDYTVQTDAHNTRTLIPMNARTQTLSLRAHSKNGPANLREEINEVTVGASLLMGTSPTTESTKP